MPDFKVTFRGDLGNLAAFDSAIKNSALSSERAITRANQNIASQIGKIDGLLRSSSGAGVFIKKNQAIADSINNTFKQSGDIIRRYVSDYTVARDKIADKFTVQPIFSEAYQSSFKEARGNLAAYEQALKKVARSEREIVNARRQFAGVKTLGANLGEVLEKRQKSVAERQKRDPGIGTALQILQNEEVKLRQAESALAAAKPGQRGIVQLRKNVADAKAEVLGATRDLALARAPFEQEVDRINKAFDRLAERERLAGERLVATENRIFRRRAFRDLDLAANATPPIQADLDRVLRDSPELQRRLLQGGLGAGTKYGTADFQRALAAQEASVSSYTRNLRTGVRTVQGEFRNLDTGILDKFTVDLDENGKVVGRWGGQLSGAGSILRQTVRDFQKVIEWTIATTVVFGSLAAVVGQLQNINELNTLLTRFAITAQTSAQQTGDMFESLTQVAINTATPLKEIVTVADDIALATKTANQSMDEWQADITALTSAVGIFTNLTGKETVAAADQLSSTFKQLGIAPQEVITVLNKVTAVAGGQANAIADIVQSISGLAEAARAAGFTVDEQIAAVQVLSQVTNKTSAEIATAFKNLFGSVSSVGSEKILAQFGIAVRDASGGVRDFLDIYRDVARALEQGIIPQNRLPDVIRGISGGPRRAPDAAALLANIGRIDEVIERSANATNEALVANAKILDTNQAKLIQFQNAVDATVFKQFGEAVRDLTVGLVDFGNFFLGALRGVPTELVTATIKLGLLIGSLTIVSKLIRLLVGATGLPALARSLRTTGTQFQATAAQMKIDAAFIKAFPDQAGMLGAASPLNRSNRPPVTGFGAGIRNNIPAGGGRLALGAAAIGAGTAVGGGIFGGGAGGFGQALAIAGGIATLVPGLQAVGITAALAGTAISILAGNTETAKDKVANYSSEIYDLTQRLKTTQDEANNYAKTQKTSLSVIEQLREKTKLTADEQGQLTTATQDYVTSTLALANANKQVADSFQEILDKLELSDKYQGFLAGIQAGGPGGAGLQELQQKLAKDILLGTGQAIFSGAAVPLATGPIRRPGGGGGTTVTGIGQRATRGGRTIEGTVVNLSDLIDDPQLITKFVDVNLGELVPGARVPQNEKSLRLLQGAVSQLTAQFVSGEGTLTQQQLDNLVKVISEMATASSTFTQNAIALGQQAAAIQAKVLTGEFTALEGQRATAANTLAQRLGTAAAGVRPQYGREGAEIGNANVTRALEVQRQLSELAEQGLQPSNALLREAVELTFKLTGQYETLGAAGEQALRIAVLETLKEIGVEQEVITALTESWGVQLQETANQAQLLSLNLDNARKNARDAFAQRSLDLEIAQNSGEFEKNAKGLQVLKQQNQEAYDSTISLIGAMEKLASTSTSSFVDLANSLSNVIGLQGQFISQTEIQRIEALEAEEQAAAWADKIDDLSSSLIENAVKAGVNAEGIRKIRDQVALLIATISAIPPYKRVIVEVQTLLRTSSTTQLGTGDFGKNLQTQLNQAKQQEAAAKKAGTDPSSVINNIIDSINRTIRTSSGSSLGKLPSTSSPTGTKAAKTVSPPDVSLLDIPEEILNSPNAQQLIKQAISSARGLQALVPGATKQNKTDIVELLNGTKRIMETRGIGEEYLRRALDELRDEIKRQNDLLSKANTIRRIRVGGGDFSAIANVPINSISGVSVGGANGPISVSLDVNGTVFSPAQLQQFADMVAASLKRQLAS